MAGEDKTHCKCMKITEEKIVRNKTKTKSD